MASPETQRSSGWRYGRKTKITVRIMKHWSGLSREVAGSLSLEVL